MTVFAPQPVDRHLLPAASPSPVNDASDSATTGPVDAIRMRAPVGLDSNGRPWPVFAHGSEAEMARILDFYAVEWAYEPTTFPILWNLDGEVIESFSPDFYLPELDLYLEMTTLKQRLVRKKNRKLRRLRELYPDIRIKLFYARDFRAMMLKYGRLALADSLSGTLGQVVPDRAPIDAEPVVDNEVVDIVEVIAAAATGSARRRGRAAVEAGSAVAAGAAGSTGATEKARDDR